MIPDVYLITEDGSIVPYELKCARGNGKSTLQLELYRQLFGIPDDDWKQILKETERKLYDQDRER